MSLQILAALSNFYGADPSFVLAGGGNTSFKDQEFLYIKPSGVTLATIKPEQFVQMDREKLRQIFSFQPPDDKNLREALVKKMTLDAVSAGSEGRPSVEAPLHELMSTTYVVHLHPRLVNGMTCSVEAEETAARLFPDALWVDYVDPGFTLAATVRDRIADFVAQNGREPAIIFLRNHGVFVGGNGEKEIRAAYDRIIDTLKREYAAKNVSLELETGPLDRETVWELAPVLRSILGTDKRRQVLRSLPPFAVAEGPFSPDHIVYAKSYALIADRPDAAAVAAFEKRHGYKPLVISVPGKAVFCAAATLKDADTVAALAQDAAWVWKLTAAFGGPNHLSDAGRSFIENWEVESYRKKVAASGAGGRILGKVAVVTGGAQGFGLGIAEGLAAEGAIVVVADMNLDGAREAADKLNAKFGARAAFAVKVNISDEASVIDMVRTVVETCGGVDLFTANAGVLRAGSVKTMEKKDWDFVTNVNYTGYFLCSKHVAALMARQNAGGGPWTDIVQINSKSGLVGSNRNGAYAGSKFGTIGLTQSFALELIDDHVKVNSVCPGNYFDGPLWMDPENGLFAQYLRSGKVPGAKTIADVKASYEAKIPMGRGCFPEDVVRAILYCAEQAYETGQAIPVSGGQVMLN